MGKFYGKLGFGHQTETAPGVFVEKITERFYSGDVKKNSRRWVSSERLNDDLDVSNVLSIVADPYAVDNSQALRYIEWHGQRWKAISVEVAYPRLEIQMGGVYNGNTGPATPDPGNLAGE